MRVLRGLFAFCLTVSFSTPTHARVMEGSTGSEPGQIIQSSGKPRSVAYQVVAKVLGDEKAQDLSVKWNAFKKSVSSFWGQAPTTAATKPTNRTPATTAQAPTTASAPSVPVKATVSAPEKILDPVAVQEKINSLPDYKRPDKGGVRQQAEVAKREIREKGVFAVAEPGRKGAALLKIKGPALPKLDIGQEPVLSYKDFALPRFDVRLEQFSVAQNLKGPVPADTTEVKKVTALKIAPAGPAKADRKDWGVDQPVTMDRIAQQIPQISLTNDNVVLQPITPMSTEEMGILAATIVFEKKDLCHLVLGLAFDLTKSQAFGDEARFYMGTCAQQLGLHSDAMDYLLPLIKAEHPEYAGDAVKALSKNLPREYHEALGNVLAEVKNKAIVSDSVRDFAHYVTARAASEKSLWARVISHASLVSNKSEHFKEAQFLLGVAKYMKEELQAAKGIFESLKASLDVAGSKNLRNLATLNLARTYFRLGDYKRAVETFRIVDKDHATWVQAMTELGWAQLAMEDFAGAIGNMYSMHSPYFQMVYKPESFVVRALGYLQICQYGDAYRTLTRLETQHREWADKIAAYRKSQSNVDGYYETVVRYLKSGSKNDVDGLPPQIIREMARRRNFLNVQDALNSKIDEKGRYQKQAQSIAAEISKAQGRMARARERAQKLTSDLKRAETDNTLVKFIAEWEAQRRSEERLAVAYGYMMEVFKQARNDFDRYEARARTRIAKEEGRLRLDAAGALKENLTDMEKQMAGILENNEFLRYEVFAGSGENIRYHVSGGGTEEAKRIPAHVKPKKILNWEFDGEYWEDEIGSYRSSLTNNCPKNRQTASQAAAN